MKEVKMDNGATLFFTGGDGEKYVSIGMYDCLRCGKNYTVNDEWSACTPHFCHACTITEERFKAATGHTPQDDALERCNCPLEARAGHWHCGWNVTHDKPNFYLSMEQVEEDRRKRGIPSALTPTQ